MSQKFKSNGLFWSTINYAIQFINVPIIITLSAPLNHKALHTQNSFVPPSKWRSRQLIVFIVNVDKHQRDIGGGHPKSEREIKGKQQRKIETKKQIMPLWNIDFNLRRYTAVQIQRCALSLEPRGLIVDYYNIIFPLMCLSLSLRMPWRIKLFRREEKTNMLLDTFMVFIRVIFFLTRTPRRGMAERM